MHTRTVHFFFASALMNVMLTMISLLVTNVKDVVIGEKEERELIATPVVATGTFITHNIIAKSFVIFFLFLL